MYIKNLLVFIANFTHLLSNVLPKTVDLVIVKYKTNTNILLHST